MGFICRNAVMLNLNYSVAICKKRIMHVYAIVKQLGFLVVCVFGFFEGEDEKKKYSLDCNIPI